MTKFLKGMMIKMKKTLVCILLCLTLCVSFAACKSKNDDNGDSTADNIAASDEGTTSSVEDIIKALNGDTSDVSSEVTQATEPATMPEGKPIKDKSAASDVKNTRFFAYFKSVSKRDNFTMTATVSSNYEGASANMPMTVVRSGDKAYMSIKTPVANGVSMTMAFISDGSKFYMLFPEGKMYMSMDAGEAGDASEAMNAISSLDFSDMEYVKTTEVTSNGKKYICEEYKSGDSTVKCYFDSKDSLVKMEMISSEGVVVLDNVTLSSKVDQNVFKVPSGYTDISTLYGTGTGDITGLAG